MRFTPRPVGPPPPFGAPISRSDFEITDADFERVRAGAPGSWGPVITGRRYRVRRAPCSLSRPMPDGEWAGCYCDAEVLETLPPLAAVAAPARISPGALVVSPPGALVLIVLAGVLTLLSLLLAGCDTARSLGRGVGVLKEAETITLPLASVRAFESALYDRQMALVEWKQETCAAGRAPGAACKLPARVCAGVDAERESIVDAHRKARRLLDAPDLVDADGARILDLILAGLGAGVSAVK